MPATKKTTKAKTAAAKPKAAAKKRTSTPASDASRLISERIEELGDWRGKTLARLRKLIHEADADVVEEWKWGGPVWSHGGIVCTGETYRSTVKLTFAHGAEIPDPKRLFTSSLEGKVRRALDVKEGETPDATAFKALFRQAVARNLTSGAKKPAK